MGKNMKAGRRSAERSEIDTMVKAIEKAEKKYQQKNLDNLRRVTIAETIALAFSITAVVLHDEFGFGRQRLEKVARNYFNYIDSISYQDRWVTLDDVVKEAENITGFCFSLGEQETEILRQYGMTNRLKELGLDDDQIRYLNNSGHDRRMKIKK